MRQCVKTITINYNMWDVIWTILSHLKAIECEMCQKIQLPFVVILQTMVSVFRLHFTNFQKYFVILDYLIFVQVFLIKESKQRFTFVRNFRELNIVLPDDF